MPGSEYETNNSGSRKKFRIWPDLDPQHGLNMQLQHRLPVPVVWSCLYRPTRQHSCRRRRSRGSWDLCSCSRWRCRPPPQLRPRRLRPSPGSPGAGTWQTTARPAPYTIILLMTEKLPFYFYAVSSCFHTSNPSWQINMAFSYWPKLWRMRPIHIKKITTNTWPRSLKNFSTLVARSQRGRRAPLAPTWP